jgi:hypothetical protein
MQYFKKIVQSFDLVSDNQQESFLLFPKTSLNRKFTVYAHYNLDAQSSLVKEILHSFVFIFTVFAMQCITIYNFLLFLTKQQLIIVVKL